MFDFFFSFWTFILNLKRKKMNMPALASWMIVFRIEKIVFLEYVFCPIGGIYCKEKWVLICSLPSNLVSYPRLFPNKRSQSCLPLPPTVNKRLTSQEKPEGVLVCRECQSIFESQHSWGSTQVLTDLLCQTLLDAVHLVVGKTGWFFLL